MCDRSSPDNPKPIPSFPLLAELKSDGFHCLSHRDLAPMTRDGLMRHFDQEHPGICYSFEPDGRVLDLSMAKKP